MDGILVITNLVPLVWEWCCYDMKNWHTFFDTKNKTKYIIRELKYTNNKISGNELANQKVRHLPFLSKGLWSSSTPVNWALLPEVVNILLFVPRKIPNLFRLSINIFSFARSRLYQFWNRHDFWKSMMCYKNIVEITIEIVTEDVNC